MNAKLLLNQQSLPQSRNIRLQLGKLGEDYAASYLEKSGFNILSRNFKARYGELDIIAQKDGILVFVEVKTRNNASFGMPEEAVTPRKLAEVKKTAVYYCMLNHCENRGNASM